MLRMKKIYFTNPDIIFNKLRNIFYFVLIMVDSPFNNLSPLIVQLLNIYIIKNVIYRKCLKLNYLD